MGRVRYFITSLDRPVIKYYNNDDSNSTGYHTVYNASGLVGLHKDVVNNRQTRYTYDLAQRLVRVRQNTGINKDNGAFLGALSYTYENKTNRLSKYVVELAKQSGTRKVTTSFNYGSKHGDMMQDAVYLVKQNNVTHLMYKYDALGRKTTLTMAMGGANKPIYYTYVGVSGNRTTTMLESISNFGERLSYTYDDNGNIETIRKNGTLQETYHYDGLNQLVRADSAAQNKSFTYTYDAGGNILSVKEYAYTTGELGAAVKTTAYGYTDGTWKDLLTSYNGQAITYDGIGNPLTYRDGMSMTWQHGRELASLTKNGVTASYMYDESGLRTRKTVGGVVTNYHVLNGVLYGEYTGANDLLYMFDEAGKRYAFLYNGDTYYYVFNGQGDIIGVTDGSGNYVARYTYDAWGKALTITDGAGADVSGNAGHIANINPFRYRGYYYDRESGLYYLQSRYYDPVVGRFINADGVLGVSSDSSTCNLFVYCGNNSISRVDPSGCYWVGVSPTGNVFKDMTMAEKYDIERSGSSGWHFYTPGEYQSVINSKKESKPKNVVDAAFKSIKADVGLGTGLKGKVSVGGADVGLGGNLDAAHLSVNRGKVDIGYYEEDMGIDIGLGIFSFNTRNSYFHSGFANCGSGSNCAGINRICPNTVVSRGGWSINPSAGFSVYGLIGVTATVEFDLEYFLNYIFN